MEKPCSRAITVHEWRHHPCGPWRTGRASMRPCHGPLSMAHALPLCSLKSAKSQAFHLTTLCLMICSTGSRGPLCQRQEINLSEPSSYADSTGHQCVLRNLVAAIHSCLKPASSSFLGWPQRQVGKTPKWWLSHAVLVTCYWITQQTPWRLLHMDLLVLV